MVPVTHAAVSPNSRLLLTVTEDHVLAVRDLENGNLIPQWFGFFPYAYFVSANTVAVVESNVTIRHLKILQKDFNGNNGVNLLHPRNSFAYHGMN
jgi:hypothetical protein